MSETDFVAADAEEDRILATKWLGEALQHRPDPRAWANLIARLRLNDHRDQRRRQRLKESESNVDQARQENLRYVAGAFTNIFEYLLEHEIFREAETQRALAMLAMALMDVSHGRRADLFEVPKAPGRPSMQTVETQVMGLTAKAMTELMRSGVARDDAAQQAARAAKAGRCAGHGKIDAAMVKGWRDRLEQGPAPGTPNWALARYNAPYPSSITPDPRVRAEFLLTLLRNNSGLHSFSE